MPPLSTRLTGDVLQQAVARFTPRCEADWDDAAEEISQLCDCVVTGAEVDQAVEYATSLYGEGPEQCWQTNYDDAAAALCDAIEARREPDAAPEGDR